MNCEDLIYIDAEYLSKKYEDENNEPIMTSLVRDEGLKAGIKIPFASGGAHTKEVKSYKVSVYGMYKGLKNSLEKYPELKFPIKHHAAMCSSTSTSEFMTDIRGPGKSLRKLSSVLISSYWHKEIDKIG
ncbi:hypothetical protein [uncultured Desulfosarcina sp.]|uniref:hypothetical protein n=1 Tax=uncultured Desulfosarcina sp. TaxID=218289 RepID=UPI0029C84A1F|nr:hypothetical protein [uncultured Desulfosarcina sp.]